MTGILAIETATDACSVALWRDGELVDCHEVAPRQHSQRVFGMLRELLPSGDLSAEGVTAIAYGAGPGSFTGLRIAASVVQGLAFAAGLPAIAVSTLACQVHTAGRLGLLPDEGLVCSAIDARINELYHASYRWHGGAVEPVTAPEACAPEKFAPPEDVSLLIGNGCALAERFKPEVRRRLRTLHPEVLPHARDLIPLAHSALIRGKTQSPSQVQPVYVRDEISWKKLSEQGKPG